MSAADDDRFSVDAGPPAEGMVTIRVQGDLDYASAGRLTEALEEVSAAPEMSVCVDLHGVGFIDSSGLRALLDARHLFPDRLFIRADGRARDLLEISGCSRFLAIN